MLNKKIIFIVLIFFIATLFLFEKLGLTKEYSDSKNYIVIAQGSKPKSLDPHKFNDFSVLAVTEHLFNTLTTVNNSGEVIPELATWEYTSPKEIVFKIREGVKFHNGEILKSDDVVFSLNRMLNEPGSFPLVKEVESVEKLDERRVKVTLKEVSAPFLGNLSMPLTGIINEKSYKENQNNIGVASIGTGPYKVKSWGEGERIVLEAHTEYFKGSPKNSGIIFKTITESSGRLAALETGEVDIVYGLAPIDYRFVENNPKLNLLDLTSLSTDYLVINTNKKYLDNVKVREAISRSINKEGIISAIYLGKGREANSVVAPNIFGAYESKNKKDYNPEKSKELLKESGLQEKEIKLNIWSSENPTRIQIAQIIQANLKDVGIESKIEVIELGGILTRTGNGEHDLLLTTWITGVTDSDTILSSLFHSSSKGASGNRAFYESKKVDELLEKGRKSINVEDRKKYYKEIQEIISEDIPVVPLVYRVDGIAISKKIENFDYNRASMRKLYENMYKIER